MKTKDDRMTAIEKLLAKKQKLEKAQKDLERKVKEQSKKARIEHGERVLQLLESAGVVDATDSELTAAFAQIKAGRQAQANLSETQDQQRGPDSAAA